MRIKLLIDPDGDLKLDVFFGGFVGGVYCVVHGVNSVVQDQRLV